MGCSSARALVIAVAGVALLCGIGAALYLRASPARLSDAELDILKPKEPSLYERVENPVRELCTDDALSQVPWVNVPFAQFSGSTIRLNGAAVSEPELMRWAAEKYRKQAEQVLWVQILPQSSPTALPVLTRLSKALPRLHVRFVDANFARCPKHS